MPEDKVSVPQPKAIQCISCGQIMKDDTIETQIEHLTITGHFLYEEMPV